MEKICIFYSRGVGFFLRVAMIDPPKMQEKIYLGSLSIFIFTFGDILEYGSESFYLLSLIIFLSIYFRVSV